MSARTADSSTKVNLVSYPTALSTSNAARLAFSEYIVGTASLTMSMARALAFTAASASWSTMEPMRVCCIACIRSHSLCAFMASSVLSMALSRWAFSEEYALSALSSLSLISSAACEYSSRIARSSSVRRSSVHSCAGSLTVPIAPPPAVLGGLSRRRPAHRHLTPRPPSRPRRLTGRA